MSTTKAKPMTYGQLKAELEKLTEEQLAMRVMWCGEERGGHIFHVEIINEDQINPSGDGWESVSDVRKYLIEDGMTEEEADAEIAGEHVCARKGQPMLSELEPVTDEDRAAALERLRKSAPVQP